MTKQTWLAVAAGVLMLSGCGDDGGDALADAQTGCFCDASQQPSRLDVSFNSSGDVLTGFLTTTSLTAAGSPGVVLVHQYLEDDEQWGELPNQLARAGYRVLAFNLHGHGDSAPYDGPLSNILSDPVIGPGDVAAARTWLIGAGQSDPNRIAIIGTSIGANLAVGAAISGDAKTYVSVSARKSAVETLAGTTASGMSSVLYMASELDGGGVQATDAQTMHDATAKPKQIHIYQGVDDHGIGILRNRSDASTRILDWLNLHL